MIIPKRKIMEISIINANFVHLKTFKKSSFIGSQMFSDIMKRKETLKWKVRNDNPQTYKIMDISVQNTNFVHLTLKNKLGVIYFIFLHHNMTVICEHKN